MISPWLHFSEVPEAVTSSSGKAFTSGSQQCDIVDLPGSLKDYYTDEKSVSQPTVKMEKEDDDSDSFANFVAQELHEHEDDNTTSMSSTSPAVSPIMPMMSSSQNENGLITNLVALGDTADIAALKIPMEECIVTVSANYCCYIEALIYVPWVQLFFIFRFP